jgi:hypothetical protein
MRLITVIMCALAIGSLATLTLERSRAGTAGAAEAASGQDVGYVDRRVSAVEQRLYSMESRIRSIEQQAMSRSSVSTSPVPTRDVEFDRLRSEVETLKMRLGQVECGLVHVDERTLSQRPGAEPRTTPADPCRQNPSTPVKLPTRP